MNNIVALNLNHLAARWWMLVVRGIAAILFGVLALALPGAGLLALVIVWAIYALIDGIFNLMLSGRAARAGASWGWLLFEGIVSVAAGLLTFFWPAITATALLIVIAVWAIITGIAEIAASIRLRREIRNEWLLALSGVLSIVFGVLLLVYPNAGALALVWLIGAYAIVFGALLIGLGLRLHHWAQRFERQFPSGGLPTAA
jgi:uncharacterized membrane protein HdeD (DUF308 family)